MIEFVSTLTIMCIAIPSFLLVIYLGMARASIKFITRQAGICLSFEKSTSTCRSQTDRLVKRLLPLGQTHIRELSRNSQTAKAKLDFKISQFHLSEKLVLDLPLKADSL